MKINEILHSLRSAYDDWGHILVNPQFIRSRDVVSWANRRPARFGHLVMASDVLKMAEENQYTFQINEDGSLVQIYYLFLPGGNEIKSASLAFYRAKPDPDVEVVIDFPVEDIVDVSTSEAENQTSDSSLETTAESIDDKNIQIEFEAYTSGELKDAPVSWLRIDYDPAASRGVLHHDCHLHISGLSTTRFVVAGLPTPKQFVELIIAAFYPTIYKSHRLNEKWEYADKAKIASVHTDCFRLSESEIYQQMIHFRVPVGK